MGVIIFSTPRATGRLDVSLALLVAAIVQLVVFVAASFLTELSLDSRAFSMSMVLGAALALGRVRQNAGWWGLAFAFLVAISWSGSRITSLAAVVGITFCAFFIGTGAARRILLATIAFALSAITVLVSFYLNLTSRSRILVPHDPDVSINIGDVHFQLSTSGWLSAWSEFIGLLDGPLVWVFGSGAGGSATLGREILTRWFSQTLNEYLRVLVDFGIVGLVLSGVVHPCDYRITFQDAKSRKFCCPPRNSHVRCSCSF